MRSYANQPAGTVDQLRTLRRNRTDAEQRLLDALKAAFPTRKWRFQVPVGPYRVDFLCFAERLVIEADGGQHAIDAAADARRDASLRREGYRVLRFWNHDILGNTEGVIAEVACHLGAPSPSHGAARRGPLPLPMGEGIGVTVPLPLGEGRSAEGAGG